MHLTQLANGVRIATCAQAGVSNAGIAIFINGGVRAQGATERGYAHLVEHLVFEAGARESAFHAIEGTINAYTGREHMALSGFVPAGDAAPLIEHFARTLVDDQFSPMAIAAERKRVELEDSLSHNSSADRTEQAVVETIWPDHPIAQPLSEHAGNLANVTASSLQRFWRRIVHGHGTFVFGAGALDHSEIAAAAQSLSDLPASGVPAWGPAPHFASGARREFGIAEGARSVWVLPMPAPHEKPHDAAEVLQHVLTSYLQLPSSPITKDERRCAHSLDSYLLRYSDACALVLELRVESGDAQRAARLCERSLKELAREGITAGAMRSAKCILDEIRRADSIRLDCQLEHLADSVLYQRAACAPATPTAVNELLRDAWTRHARLTWTGR